MTAPYKGLTIHGDEMMPAVYEISAGVKWKVSTMVYCKAMPANAKVNP